VLPVTPPGSFEIRLFWVILISQLHLNNKN